VKISWADKKSLVRCSLGHFSLTLPFLPHFNAFVTLLILACELYCVLVVVALLLGFLLIVLLTAHSSTALNTFDTLF